jgi:hypothetical protein
MKNVVPSTHTWSEQQPCGAPSPNHLDVVRLPLDLVYKHSVKLHDAQAGLINSAYFAEIYRNSTDSGLNSKYAELLFIN